MTDLHLDLETKSRCDLKAEGLARYAEDPSTDVHCAAYAFGDGPVLLWRAGQPCPADVRSHIESGSRVVAHNFAFEIALANNVLAVKHGWPKMKIEQGACTMCMAYAMALPGALEKAAPALGLELRKDALGKRIMMQLCQPNKDGKLWEYDDDPDKFEKLFSYCRQDVVVERALHKRMLELSPDEQKLWVLDYQINQRGVLVDLPAIAKALKLVAAEKARLDAEMLALTDGDVGKCTEVALLVKWIKHQGVKVPGLAKADVLDALSGDIPDNVRQALELRKEAAKSSTAKLLAMQERANADGRVRGIHQFHGASTGRWAGRGVQMQNLPRSKVLAKEEIEEIFEILDGVCL